MSTVPSTSPGRAPRRPQHDATSSFGLPAGGYRSVLEALCDARKLLVYSGSGLSADSGLPTYRGAGEHLWSEDTLEKVSTLEGFRKHLAQAQHWHDIQALRLQLAQPHPGHQALAAAEGTWSIGHVTQNIDRLLERAGCGQVEHLHGVFDAASCLQCGTRRRGTWRPLSTDACRRCGAHALRPDIVFMSEPPAADVWQRCQRLADAADVVLVVGTPAEMYPGAGLVERAHARGAKVLVINPEWCENLYYAHWQLFGTAAQVLPTLLADASRQRHLFPVEEAQTKLSRLGKWLERCVAQTVARA